MILTYSHTRFPALIKAGIKIHTIRQDLGNRWKPGRPIQHWMHNPRNVSKHPHEFCQERKDKCISVQQFDMCGELIAIDNRLLSAEEIETLAYNDGLENSRIFFKWFPEVFIGKIIHWTDLKY